MRGLSAGDWGLAGLSWLAAVNCRAPLLAVGPLLPLMAPDLDLTPSLAGVVTALPLLLIGGLSIPAGVIGDRFGPRTVLALTQVGIVLGCFARAAAGDTAALLVGTAVIGASIGIGQPALAQIARQMPTLGPTLGTAIYSGGFIVGSLGGAGLTVPFVLALAGGTWQGALLTWAVASTGAAFGWSVVAPRGERRHSAPRRFDWSLWEIVTAPGMLLIVGLYMGQSAMFYGLSAWLPTLYVAEGWSLEAAASTLFVFQLTSGLAGVGAPLTVARWGGSRPAMMLGAGGCTLGLAGLLVAPSTLPLAWATLVGAGTATIFVLCLTAPAMLVPVRRTGAAAGTLLALGNLGSATGPFALGLLRDLTGSFQPGLAFLLAISAAMALAAPRSPRSLDGRRAA